MRSREHRGRSLALMLALSVLLHAALLLWWRHRGVNEVPPAPSWNTPVEVELSFEAPTAPSPAVEAPPPSRPVAKASRPRVSTGSAPSEPGPQREGTSEPGPDVPLAEAGSPSGGLVLTPRTGVVVGGAEEGAPSEPATVGSTVTNSPYEHPDAQAVAEYTEETLKRKLDADLGGRGSRAPAYFTRMQMALNDEAAAHPVELREKRGAESVRDAVKDTVETWRKPAEQFGATGSPGTAREVEDSALSRGLNAGHPVTGDMNNLLQSLGSFELMNKSASRERLRTVVGLQTDYSGALAEVRILQHSTDPQFDEYVLFLTRKAFRDQGERDIDNGELPYNEHGWSSQWQFTWEPPKVKVRLLKAQKGPLPPPFP